jgi:hypothetical protein
MMKLSEAIRMNGMIKPQGFGMRSLSSQDAPCVIGGALQAIGKQQSHDSLMRAWPWTGELRICPVCSQQDDFTSSSIKRDYPWLAINVIWHLNDTHLWSRQRIADWVASVEPKDEQTDGGQGPVAASLEVQAV